MLNNLLFPTEEDRLLLTIVDTDHDQDLVPTAQVRTLLLLLH